MSRARCLQPEVSLALPALLPIVLLCLLFCSPAHAQGARIIEWVEDAPLSDTNSIALGYPVPIPVDTPIPFDGFRTYAGLHTRHQDLASSSDYIHPESIGLTRSGRTIWAYRLGDGDRTRRDGQAEQATLTNGGIHAREWQTPEVVTGIMEIHHEQQDDNWLFSYRLLHNRWLFDSWLLDGDFRC